MAKTEIKNKNKKEGKNVESSRVKRKKVEKQKDRIIVVLLLIVIILILILLLRKCDGRTTEKGEDYPQLETTQGAYVKPETPVDRSKSVTMPGWGGFTIKANETYINEGFEYHNPDTNSWYVSEIYHVGKYLEDIVVDSGTKVELSHLTKLIGIKEDVTKVNLIDNKIFKLTKEDNKYYIEAINGDYEETKIIVTCGNKEYTFDIKSKYDYYYMTFALYLTDTNEKLYQSGLVKPGMFIQEMTLSRALEAGQYKAYIFVQPYYSDGKTKTNSGKVNIDLEVK